MSTAQYKGKDRTIEEIATMVRACFRDCKRRTLFLYDDNGDRDGFLIISKSYLSDGVYIRSESRNNQDNWGNTTIYPEITRKSIISIIEGYL